MAPTTRNMQKRKTTPSEKPPAKKQKRKSIEEEETTVVPPPLIVETELTTTVPMTGTERREEDEQDESGEEEEEEENDESGEEENDKNEEEEEENDESGEEENDESGERREEEGDQSEEEEGDQSGEEENDESPGVMRPELFLKPDVYCKSIKLPTRCFVGEVVETFRKLDMTPMERKWFEEHPQFRHILHMPISNHMVQPLWMMLMRTAKIERKKEAWFVVNGVPIRYGLQEHALISGLNCRNYPMYWSKKGKYYMKEKYFPDTKKVLREDVKKKLEEMEADDSGERLKMMVLYFLSSIIYAPTKTGDKGTGVLDVFLKYAGDLEMCKTFPWGRLSFDRMLESISDVMNHLVEKGLGDACSFPGFCIPLEILPTEAILQLKEGLREDVPRLDDECPRMCRSKWKKCGLRGWPLETVYEKLGCDNKDIDSVLIASELEEAILDMIMEREDDNDEHDPIVESWENRIDAGFTVVFEDMKEEDVKGRRIIVEEGARAKNGGKRMSLRDAMENMTEQLGLLNIKVHEMDERIKTLEETIKAQQPSGS